MLKALLRALTDWFTWVFTIPSCAIVCVVLWLVVFPDSSPWAMMLGALVGGLASVTATNMWEDRFGVD